MQPCHAYGRLNLKNELAFSILYDLSINKQISKIRTALRYELTLFRLEFIKGDNSDKGLFRLCLTWFFLVLHHFQGCSGQHVSGGTQTNGV
jgi:hypothetical protein